MRKGEKSKRRLIECAADLFWRKGYHATAINDILKEAGLPKGSFYFYFDSKKALAAEVVEYYKELTLNTFREYAVDCSREVFVDRVCDYLSGTESPHRGCPFAVIGMETAFLEEDIAKRYMLALKEAENLFAEVIAVDGVREKAAGELAGLLFSVYEGRLLLYRMSGDPAQLDLLRKDMKTVVRMKTPPEHQSFSGRENDNEEERK